MSNSQGAKEDDIEYIDISSDDDSTNGQQQKAVTPAPVKFDAPSEPPRSSHHVVDKTSSTSDEVGEQTDEKNGLKESDGDVNDQQKYHTVWSCDFCYRAFDDFSEAEQHETICKHNPVNKDAIQKDDTLGKTKRGSGGIGKGAAPKRQKEVDVFPPSLKVKIGDMGATLQMTDEGNQFYLAPSAPLDGIPLIASFTSEESKKLSPVFQHILQQVEFFNLSSLTLSQHEKERHSNAAVGLRCQHCVSNKNGCGYIELSSVKELPSDIVSICKDHLIYCKSIDESIGSKLRLNAGEPHQLHKYCEHIVKLYGLQDSNGTVVWGTCPSIPSGYDGSPSSINIDFAFDSKSSFEKNESIVRGESE